jgi:hypothetical protein
MKIVSRSAIAFAITFFFIQEARSQNCEASFFASKGARIETTEYDAKSKSKKSKKVYYITDVQSDNQGMATKIHSVKTEKDGKVSEDKEFSYLCTADGIEMGLGLQDPKKIKQDISLKYPSNMSAGMDLKPDLTYDVFENKGGKTAEGDGQVSITIKNRKVVGAETIQVKAGSWKCTKIIYDFTVRFAVGAMGFPINLKVTEWFNPEVGVVKSETWTKKKMESFSEITAISK